MTLSILPYPIQVVPGADDEKVLQLLDILVVTIFLTGR